VPNLTITTPGANGVPFANSVSGTYALNVVGVPMQPLGPPPVPVPIPVPIPVPVNPSIRVTVHNEATGALNVYNITGTGGSWSVNVNTPGNTPQTGVKHTITAVMLDPEGDPDVKSHCLKT
jgi:hypothetical protein